MILSDRGILAAMKGGDIVLDPFDIKNLGGNSYDIHLSRHFAQYTDPIIDAAKDNLLHRFEIPPEGFLMLPGQLYLGVLLNILRLEIMFQCLREKVVLVD